MSPLKAWFLAARPKTLTGAAAPVLMDGAYAYETQGMLTLRMAWVFFMLAVQTAYGGHRFAALKEQPSNHMI